MMKATKVILAVLWAVIPAATALADDGYEVGGVEDAGLWKPLGVAALAVVAIGVLAFKNAKRTHLD